MLVVLAWWSRCVSDLCSGLCKRLLCWWLGVVVLVPWLVSTVCFQLCSVVVSACRDGDCSDYRGCDRDGWS